jgi:dihydrodipicolinate synthase/N-acetylneuraminate lyase
MKVKKKYHGVVIPAITPLTHDYKLDHGAVEKMFANFYEHDAVPFILGTTGEAASLCMEVKRDFISTAARFKKPGTMLYAGIASNCFEESVELARLAFEAGIDVVAANLPSYYQLINQQIKTYFEHLADAVQGPLIIYNIPATTHMSIPLDIIDELSYRENIVGTKDSERSEERLSRSLELWANRQDFSHFAGWAAQSANALLNGGDGLIPSTGNLHPAIYRDLDNAVNNGDKAEAAKQQKLSDLWGAVYQSGRTLGGSLAALKALMQEKGLCQSHMMPPLEKLSAEEESTLHRQLQHLIDQHESDLQTN